MKKLKKSVAAFTLVELLIVMAIITLIAFIAIGSYAGVQKTARLDLAGDAFISLIKEQIQLAHSGQRIFDSGQNISDLSGNKLSCFALKFDNASFNSKEFIMVGRSNYHSVGTQAQGNADKVDFCDFVDSNKWESVDFLDDTLVLKDIEQTSLLLGNASNQISNEPLEIYFKPPFAKVFLKKGNDFLRAADQIYYFQIGYKDASSPTDNKKIQYNIQTGELKKIAISP